MMRRTLDILVSGAALFALAPVFALLAFLVRLKEGSPVFFLQWRAGRGGVPFRLIKFRTMRLNAEKSGGSLTFRADPRITGVGRVFRKFKLDELPQFWNVLRGEMTLIGPRPEVLDWVERYTPEQRLVLNAKPGLSDPVQLLFRHEQDYLTTAAEYEHLVAMKVHLQLEYLRTRTLLSDLFVALASARAVFPSKPSAAELAVYASIRESCRAGLSPRPAEKVASPMAGV
jgi:lipopolysaccharide/colanic/teichoic acid biosynthesis glycosyltransferase